MKCRVCSAQIPEGKKCCPRCGRVVTATDVQSDNSSGSNTYSVSDRTMVYRPAASKSSQPQDRTININDIFSSDPNAPVYTDPHTYDKATADVLEYDRMFMSKSTDADDDVKIFEPDSEPVRTRKNPNYTIEPEYDDASDYDDTDDADDDYPSSGSVIRDKKKGKPHFNFNIRYLIIAVAVIAGIIVIVFGTYQLGKQFGIIGESDESESVNAAETVETSSRKAEKSSDIDNSYTEQTGVYTVYSDQNNIFVYKSVSDQRIIATIPNKTIIEITEISNGFGKTTYNSYTGWVELDELKFTPNETPEQTTEKETESGETVAQYQTGTYTVTLNGESTSLRVRSINSTSGEIVTTLSEGDQVTVEEINGSWGKIFVGDIEGWVYMEYLK